MPLVTLSGSKLSSMQPVMFSDQAFPVGLQVVCPETERTMRLPVVRSDQAFSAGTPDRAFDGMFRQIRFDEILFAFVNAVTCPVIALFLMRELHIAVDESRVFAPDFQ